MGWPFPSRHTDAGALESEDVGWFATASSALKQTNRTVTMYNSSTRKWTMVLSLFVTNLLNNQVKYTTYHM